MKPPTRSTIAVVTMVATVAACSAASDATSGSSDGNESSVAPRGTTPATSTASPTSTQLVTVTATSGAAPTITSTPARADPRDVYALDLVSGTTSRLTADPRLDGAPAWMPDGERLLFGRLESGSNPTIGNADTFLITADGTTEPRLTDHPASDVIPRSSPDRTTVVFTSERDGKPEIYRLDLATRALRRLTNEPAGDRFPAFSPDGHTIVLTSDRAGSDDVYLMDAGGSAVRRLTDTPGADWLVEFSPGGASIALPTDHSIDVIDSKGSNRIALTADAANHPSWSPDGRRIAAVTRNERGDFAICTIDVSTAAITVLTGDFYPRLVTHRRQHRLHAGTEGRVSAPGAPPAASSTRHPRRS